MAQCKAKTTNGQPCRSQAIKGSQFCFIHDPAQGTKRAQARKKGGQRRRVAHHGDLSKIPAQVRTIGDVLAVLDYALIETLAHENSIQRGRLIVAIAGAFIEAIKTGEFEARLAALEELQKQR
ncbi:hypothetical protein FBQ81_12695 [Chloroflexi bacterium CFX6]|nr:hypothetical protein [Chloroflexi bacterium CFX6]